MQHIQPVCHTEMICCTVSDTKIISCGIYNVYLPWKSFLAIVVMAVFCFFAAVHLGSEIRGWLVDELCANNVSSFVHVSDLAHIVIHSNNNIRRGFRIKFSTNKRKQKFSYILCYSLSNVILTDENRPHSINSPS